MIWEEIPKILHEEVTTYLGAVEVFREEGHDPQYPPENMNPEFRKALKNWAGKRRRRIIKERWLNKLS